MYVCMHAGVYPQNFEWFGVLVCGKFLDGHAHFTLYHHTHFYILIKLNFAKMVITAMFNHL